MGFKLFWDDPNLTEDGHRVYRDTSTMDPESLPSPITTLGADVTAYDDHDDTIIDLSTYYYRVSAYLGSIEQASDEVSLIADANDPVVKDVNFYYKMNQISGSTITDDNSINDGTIINGATQVTFGSTGYALLFDGIDQAVSLPYPKLSTDEFANLSVGCWFKTSAVKNQILVSFDRSEFYRLELIALTEGSGVRFSFTTTTAGIFELNYLIDVFNNEWHQITATYDSGLVRIYLDGYIKNQYNFGTLIGNPNLTDRYGYIGVGSEADTEGGTQSPLDYFEGMMTKVFEMYRTMSSQEVFSMYQQGAEI